MSRGPPEPRLFTFLYPPRRFTKKNCTKYGPAIPSIGLE
jgi:hypothetical protein